MGGRRGVPTLRTTTLYFLPYPLSFHILAHSRQKNSGGVPGSLNLDACSNNAERGPSRGQPVTSHFADYPAMSSFCAKGHSRSIHCPSQCNPVRAASAGISSAWYLCELSVRSEE